MRRMFSGVVIAAGVLLVSVPLLAHHGAAALDTGKEVTVKGTVTEWIWSNPHCFLQFDAKDDSGTVRNWAVETRGHRDARARQERPADRPAPDGRPAERTEAGRCDRDDAAVGRSLRDHCGFRVESRSLAIYFGPTYRAQSPRTRALP